MRKRISSEAQRTVVLPLLAGGEDKLYFPQTNERKPNFVVESCGFEGILNLPQDAHGSPPPELPNPNMAL